MSFAIRRWMQLLRRWWGRDESPQSFTLRISLLSFRKESVGARNALVTQSDFPADRHDGPVAHRNTPVDCCKTSVEPLHSLSGKRNGAVTGCKASVDARNTPVGHRNTPVDACNWPVDAQTAPILDEL